MSTTQANHDHSLSHSAGGQNSSSNVGSMNNAPGGAGEAAPLQIDSHQLLSILRNIPELFGKIPQLIGGDGKDSDAAQTLSNLSQSNFTATHQLPQLAHQLSLAHAQAQSNPFPHGDPGPSSHPRGPPNLGDLSAIASQSQPISATRTQQLPQDMDDGGSDGEEGNEMKDAKMSPPAPTSGKRGGRSATMGSEEWTRQRKDNHKEVERRRRGNINEGINELGRIVPNGSGEKAKGAILSRAVQYIHHLKENEARNIEKWTLEKLLMDQAMGDLQNQLDEVRRLWDDERNVRQRLENEVNLLRGGSGKTSHIRSRSPAGEDSDHDEEEGVRGGKRPRVE